MDLTSVLASINGVGTDVTTVGVACLSALAVVITFTYIRRVMK